MKKGVFFTLGLTIFALIFLALSFTYTNNLSQYDKRFIEQTGISRVYDLDTSIQKSVSKLFLLDSGMTYTASPTQAIFQQNLPFNMTPLNTSYTVFRNFAVSNDKNVQLETLNKNFSLVILPLGIVYYQNLSRNSSSFLPTDKKPTAYSYDISLFEANVTSCNSSYTAGSFSFSVVATGGNGSYCNIGIAVDPLLSASIGVSHTGGSLTISLANYSSEVVAGKSKFATTSTVTYNEVPLSLETIELQRRLSIIIPGVFASKSSFIRIY